VEHPGGEVGAEEVVREAEVDASGLLEARAQLFGDLDIDAPEVVFELVDGAAPEDRDDLAAAVQPGDRQSGGGAADLACRLEDGAGDREASVGRPVAR
jgi:hypothetical protein